MNSRRRELREAVASNDLDRVKELIRNGVREEPRPHRNSVLHICANEGNMDIMEVLLEVCVTFLNHKNRKGDTPLHVAVKGEHEDIVHLLLRHEFDVNATNNEGNTALHLATIRLTQIEEKKKWYSIIKMLINKCANIGIVNNAGMTVLAIVVDNNFLEAFQNIVDSCTENPIRWELSNHMCALYFMVFEGPIYIVNIVSKENSGLSAMGHFDVFTNTVNTDMQESSLLDAILILWLGNISVESRAEEYHDDVMLFRFDHHLLNSRRLYIDGRRINDSNEWNEMIAREETLKIQFSFVDMCENVLRKAMQENNFMVIEALVMLRYRGRVINTDHLLMAIENQVDDVSLIENLKIIRFLINTVPYSGNVIVDDHSILGHAVINNKEEVFNDLLVKGYIPIETDRPEVFEIMKRHAPFLDSSQGLSTTFRYFPFSEIFDKKEYFLNAKVPECVVFANSDFSQIRVNRDKFPTPLHVAAMFPNANVQKLIEAGCDVNCENAFKENPLFFAANRENAELLLRSGCNIDHKNYAGENIFHGVVQNLHHSTDINDYLEFLIQLRGHLLNDFNHKYWTPLYQAIYLNKDDIAAEFIRHGVMCPFTRFNPDRSPALFAVERKKFDLVNLMIRAGELPQPVPKVMSLQYLCILSTRRYLHFIWGGIFSCLKRIQKNIWLSDMYIDMLMFRD